MSSGYDGRDKADPLWWMQQVRTGVEHRKKLTFESQWGEWRNFYRNNFAMGTMPVPVFYKMMRTMIPRIYFRNPSVSITPRKGQQGQFDYAILASLLERLDNTMMDRMRIKHSMKRSIQDAIQFGTGVLKLGYGAEFTPTPEPVGSTEAPTSKKGHRYEYHDFIQPDMPWVLRCRTGNFITPAGVEDWPSARWCAMVTRRHVDDVRDDPRLRNVKDIKPGTTILPGDSGGQKLEGMVDLYEIRDKKAQRVIVLAPFNGSDKVLLEEDDDLQFSGRLPYFPIQFNTDDEFFWATPDSHILRAHQIERNAIATAMQKHRRASTVKWKVKQGSMTADEQAKLNSDEVNAILNIDDEHNLSDIERLEASDIPDGLMKMMALEDQEIQEILGLGVNQMGEYAPGSSDRSATEAQIVNQSTQIRTDERRDTIADVMTEIVEQMNHLILDRWNENDQIVDILGPEGAQLWVQFKPGELKTLDYDVKVDPDSTIPETRQLRQQKAAELFKALQNDPLIDQIKLRRYALTEIGGPALVDLMVQQQPGQQPGPQQPGAPGSAPNNPIPLPALIQRISEGARGAQVPQRKVG